MAKPTRKIDPRELIPATRPRRRFEQGPIPPAPLVGNTQIDFAMNGVQAVISPLVFTLPTTRVKPRGVVFVYDLNVYHSEAGKTLQLVSITRQAPEDASPIAIFTHQHLPGIALPHTLNFATPIPFPLGGDAIYNYTPSISLGVSAVGGVGAIMVLNVNWVFYEWDAATGIGGTPALGGIAASASGFGLKRVEFSE